MAKPDPLAAYRAQGIPLNPVGSLDEVIAHKLPTRAFASCAEPTPDETVRGCPYWYECTMSYKGRTAAEGGGPRNHAWERLVAPGNGGGTVTNVQPCYWGVAEQENAMLNKEVLRPVADEGEDYTMVTTVPVPEGGRNNDGYLKWEEREIVAKVQEFTRLGKEPKLVRQERRAKIIERDQQRIRDEHAAKMAGIAGAAEPLDKRSEGDRKGPSKKG